MIESLFPKIFSLLSLACIIGLGIIVVRNGWKLINKLFLLLTIILIIWVFGSFMMFSGTSSQQIIFWDRFVYSGIIFWAIIQYHFSLALSHFNRTRKSFLIFGYFLFFGFLLISQTDYFVSGIFYYTWGAHMKAQTAHHFFMAFFAFYVILFFYTLLKKYHNEPDKLKKKRILVYIIGFSVLDFIGGTAFLPAYQVAIYPIFLATPLIFSIIITYSIVYFGLMNIKLIMRRYFVYFLSVASCILPEGIILYNIYLFYPTYLIPAFVIFYISSLLSFNWIRKSYYRFANRYFFSSLYDSNELIYNLNKHLRSSLDIKKTFASVTDILIQAFHSRAIATVNFDYKKEQWSVLYNHNFLSLSLASSKFNHDIIKDIFSKNKPLLLEDIKEFKQPQNNSFIATLKNLNIKLVVPVKIKKTQLNGLMFFGPKESGEIYNDKDLKVLELIAGEIGVTVENALLYQSVKKFNVKLKNEISKATKKLQEQNKTLKKLDQVKDEFIGVVSHQLRTPLTGIRWFTELLIKNKKKNLNVDQLNLLKHIGSSNLSLIKLVNDLLDVSHIETGHKFTIVKKLFNINELLAEVIKENIYLIETKKLIIDNEIPDTFEIYADRDKIKQVWQNLITNASKYSKENARIRIYFKLKKEVAVTFYVQDDGIGIPKKQQVSLFTKFFRASNAALQYTEGTGLGLYIAREIVRAHDGEMSFKSVENKGSIFYFSLPVMLKN